MQQAEKKQKPVIGQDSEDLVEWYNRMIALYPRNIQARCKLGWLLQNLGRYQEALTQWQEVLKIDVNNLTAREAILQLNHLMGEKASSGEIADRRETGI